MTGPRIVLALGPVRAPDAIVIDYANGNFWRGNQRGPMSGVRSNGLTRMFKLNAALLAASPKYLTWEEIYEVCWGEDACGPARVENTVSVMRNKSAPLYNWLRGYTLNRWGYGVAFVFREERKVSMVA